VAEVSGGKPAVESLQINVTPTHVSWPQTGDADAGNNSRQHQLQIYGKISFFQLLHLDETQTNTQQFLACYILKLLPV